MVFDPPPPARGGAALWTKGNAYERRGTASSNMRERIRVTLEDVKLYLCLQTSQRASQTFLMGGIGSTSSESRAFSKERDAQKRESLGIAIRQWISDWIVRSIDLQGWLPS